MNVVTLPTPEPESSPAFADFWDLWPAERRVCKKQATQQWDRMDDAQRVAALVGLVGWRRVWRARGEFEFVPHPHRWLRDERYEDALPSQVSHASHLPASSTPLPPRTGIPESVRAVLAKLRGQG
jgi:hypothetical protein